MADLFLPAYERYSWRVVPRILIAAWRARESLRRASLLNRYRDYLNLARRPDLLPLHRALNEQLVASARNWESYDYGEGYFYQSCPQIGVSGLRDTAARVEAMGLREKLAGRRVLEIGCNSGFVALSVADVAGEVTGFDINPHLVQVAREAAIWLKADNAGFEVCSFENFTADGPFNAVLSFANHHTYDGNTRQDLETYFRKCRELLVPGGLFLFESHAPDHEGEGLAGVIETIGRLFTIRERRVLNVGSFLDRGRTFVVSDRPA
jgi:SAM-dependent methyltransferase